MDGTPYAGGNALTPGDNGGGIFSLGCLTVIQCHFTGNKVGRGGDSTWTSASELTGSNGMADAAG